jgi:peptidoglycan/xylan/chitin deacetylase (PgdA/CDA1 family)
VRTEQNPGCQQSEQRLGPDSQNWVNASLSSSSWSDWREFLLHGMRYTGVLGTMRRFVNAYEVPPPGTRLSGKLCRVKEPKSAILCYHGIGESGNPLGDAVSKEAFEAQVRYLHRHYRVVSLGDVWRGLANPGSAQPTVTITFDDGYRNAYTAALPILQKYNVTATIFVAVEAVETDQILWYDKVFLAMAIAASGQFEIEMDSHFRFTLESAEDRWRAALEMIAWLRTLPDSRRRECCALLERKVTLPQQKVSGLMLTWDQIQTMHRAGISFGSHTLAHPVVSRLSADELDRELMESKRTLEEKLGTPVLDFAYPFGKPSDCSRASQEAISRCGYRTAVTTVPGVNYAGASPYRLRRIQVGRNTSMARFSFELSRAFFKPSSPIPLSEFPATSTSELVATPSACDPRVLGSADA